MRTPTGTLLRAGLSVLVVVAAVAACSGGDDPKPGTLATSKPVATSVSPTPSTPEAQIEAAVRNYYAELTRAAQTNDTSKLVSLTTKACPCFRSVGVINNNRKQGERTPEAVFKVESVRVHDVDGNSGLAEVRTSATAYDVLRGAKVIDHIEAQTAYLDLSFVRASDGRWIIGNEFNLGGS